LLDRAPRLGAVTVADAAQLDGQLLGVQQLPSEQTAERDLGGGDQAEIGVFDAVDLSFRTARQ
jgi:hypothetical protein